MCRLADSFTLDTISHYSSPGHYPQTGQITAGPLSPPMKISSLQVDWQIVLFCVSVVWVGVSV